MIQMKMKRWSISAICLLLVPVLQAEEPILLQGQADPDPDQKSWYNSRDPGVLNSQIHLLEKTILDQRKALRDQEDTVKYFESKTRRLTKRLEQKAETAVAPEPQIVEVPAPADAKLRDDLTKARQQILKLEEALSDAQSAPAPEAAPPADTRLRENLTDARQQIFKLKQALSAAQSAPAPDAPAAIDNSGHVKELNALVRTYEKTIASLEGDLTTLRRENETQQIVIEEKEKSIHSLKAVLKESKRVMRTVEPTPAAAVLPVIEEVPEVAKPELDIPAVSPPVSAPAPAPLAVATPEAIQEAAPVEEETPAIEDTPAAEPETPSSNNPVEDGFNLLQDGKNDAAEKLFKQVSKDDPNYAKAQLGLATVLYSQDMIPEASIKVAEVLDLSPNNPQGLGLKGIISWREGRISEADELLSRALELDSKDAQLHNYHAIVLHARGSYLEAEEALKESIQLDPDHPEAHFNLAVLNTIGPIADRKKAQEYYEKAVLLGSQRDPQFEATLYRE